MNIKTYEYTDETLTELVNYIKEATLKQIGLEDRAGEFAFIVRQPNILGKMWNKINGEDQEGHLMMSVIWSKKAKAQVPGGDTLS
jgi:hypothetical protein